MSLAETTAALSKKESEKSQVLEDIKYLEQLKDQNIVAKLNVSVYEIVGLPTDSIAVFNYGLLDGRYVEKVDTHYIAKNLGEQVQFDLLSKEGKVTIECTFTQSENENVEVQHKVEFSVIEIPEVGELRTDISSRKIISESEDSINDIDLMISSKHLELEQLKQEFKDISVRIQEAKKKQISGTSSKKRGKGKEVKVKRNTTSKIKSANTLTDNDDKIDESLFSENQISFVEKTLSIANTVGTFMVENRAYTLFVVFAAAIYQFGDYASV